MNAWELQAEYFNTRTRLIMRHFSLVQSSHSQPLHTILKRLFLSKKINFECKYFLSYICLENWFTTLSNTLRIPAHLKKHANEVVCVAKKVTTFLSIQSVKVTRGEAAFASHSFVQIFKTFFLKKTFRSKYYF